MSHENMKKSKRVTVASFQKLGKKVKSIDIFGEGVGFNVGDG